MGGLKRNRRAERVQIPWVRCWKTKPARIPRTRRWQEDLPMQGRVRPLQWVGHQFLQNLLHYVLVPNKANRRLASWPRRAATVPMCYPRLAGNAPRRGSHRQPPARRTGSHQIDDPILWLCVYVSAPSQPCKGRDPAGVHFAADIVGPFHRPWLCAS